MIKYLVLFSVPPQNVLFFWQARKSRACCPLTALVLLRDIMVKGLRATTLRVHILVTT